MRKLKLDLNELSVESFRTSRPQQARGTVRANESQASEVDEYGESEATGCTCATGWFTLACAMESFAKFC